MKEWLEELDWKVIGIGCGCGAVFLCLVTAALLVVIFAALVFGISVFP